MFCSFLLPFVLKGDSCFIYVIRIYLPILLSNTISISEMILSFLSNAKGITSGAGTANLPEYFSSLRYLRGFMLLKSLVFCVVFCRSLFVLLSLRSEFRVVMSATTSA
jgi:hypothetical protein